MIVGVIRFDLRLFGTASLKQKRSLVKRLLQRIRSSCPVSMAEVGHGELLQRCLLGGSMTSTSEALISSVFRSVEDIIASSGMVEIIDIEVEFNHYGDDFH